MRKITREAVQAFINGDCNFRKDNTEVLTDGKDSILRLHGNAIACMFSD